jgi:hypothetical protein
MGERKEVFVTVGTTSFDKLVAAVDSSTVKEALYRRGFSHLQIQIGRGTYLPSKVCFCVCLHNSIASTNLVNSCLFTERYILPAPLAILVYCQKILLNF